MRHQDKTAPQPTWKRGAVTLTFDTERIWGYLDRGGEARFEQRFPDAAAAGDRLLDALCARGLSATWSVVGALSLSECDGGGDARLAGLPPAWIRHVRAGDEHTAPLWYARRFIERIRDAGVAQEIGLHGGLTHLCWSDPETPPSTARRELEEGIRALEEISVTPTSFTFPRNFEAHHHLLREYGIRCYRGLGPSPEETLRRTTAGSAVRWLYELGRATPPAVLPAEKIPGLWNVPSSMFLYRMSESRGRLAPLAGRVARVRQGIREAARHKRLFHLWLHPENLAESARAFPVFEAILDEIAAARAAGDIDVLTMTGAAERSAAERLSPARMSPVPAFSR